MKARSSYPSQKEQKFTLSQCAKVGRSSYVSRLKMRSCLKHGERNKANQNQGRLNNETNLLFRLFRLISFVFPVDFNEEKRKRSRGGKKSIGKSFCSPASSQKKGQKAKGRRPTTSLSLAHSYGMTFFVPGFVPNQTTPFSLPHPKISSVGPHLPF